MEKSLYKFLVTTVLLFSLKEIYGMEHQGRLDSVKFDRESGKNWSLIVLTETTRFEFYQAWGQDSDAYRDLVRDKENDTIEILEARNSDREWRIDFRRVMKGYGHNQGVVDFNEIKKLFWEAKTQKK